MYGGCGCGDGSVRWNGGGCGCVREQSGSGSGREGAGTTRTGPGPARYLRYVLRPRGADKYPQASSGPLANGCPNSGIPILLKVGHGHCPSQATPVSPLTGGQVHEADWPKSPCASEWLKYTYRTVGAASSHASSWALCLSTWRVRRPGANNNVRDCATDDDPGGGGHTALGSPAASRRSRPRLDALDRLDRLDEGVTAEREPSGFFSQQEESGGADESASWAGSLFCCERAGGRRRSGGRSVRARMVRTEK
ncbi:hypothetical protein F4802DRAFT_343369 [Xylaria palmicola]|nr:hypothetical protein F4802DRAFT_343369 [Xylaria palmicola]